jgi:hypothetical protein
VCRRSSELRSASVALVHPTRQDFLHHTEGVNHGAQGGQRWWCEGQTTGRTEGRHSTGSGTFGYGWCSSRQLLICCRSWPTRLRNAFYRSQKRSLGCVLVVRDSYIGSSSSRLAVPASASQYASHRIHIRISGTCRRGRDLLVLWESYRSIGGIHRVRCLPICFSEESHSPGLI